MLNLGSFEHHLLQIRRSDNRLGDTCPSSPLDP
jgi:hypothetical protein